MCERYSNPLTRVTLALGLPYLLENRALTLLVLFYRPWLGNYLYFEASSPASPGQTSCFFSQEFPGGSCQRLTFWYHMLGTGIGKLAVQVKKGEGTETVWETPGEQGDKWLQASLEIKSNSPYKVLRIALAGCVLKTDYDVTTIKCLLTISIFHQEK